MPYIKSEKRPQFESVINELVDLLRKDESNVAGNLNYVTTCVIKRYLVGKVNYKNLNEIIGALECIKLEMYREQVAGYEISKKTENGDAV